jgi:hypothetical protein
MNNDLTDKEIEEMFSGEEANVKKRNLTDEEIKVIRETREISGDDVNAPYNIEPEQSNYCLIKYNDGLPKSNDNLPKPSKNDIVENFKKGSDNYKRERNNVEKCFKLWFEKCLPKGKAKAYKEAKIKASTYRGENRLCSDKSCNKWKNEVLKKLGYEVVRGNKKGNASKAGRKPATKATKQEIVNLYENGLSKRKIIEQLHVSKTTIDEVLLNL